MSSKLKNIDGSVRKAVFLDRDGVINRVIMRDGKPCSPRNVQEFEWEDGIADGIKRLKEEGLIVIVVTNQPDISRRKMHADTLDAMTKRVYSDIPVDDVWLCPHDDIDDCDCRKPKAGLLLEAAKMWGIDCTRSFMIGDSWRDTEAGNSAGCITILLDREYNQEVDCDYRVGNLNEAIELIIKSEL